ncbi:alpha/beta fold hydrolase [Terriglobus albidus]|uniref:alpha/beta fold hydrolase n=1 Tax=Terriglobus albidus TaxID=1592106 RepID=UPI0021E03AAF|nr:alpha/beta hydrolase [Terriglobus albidus]
MAALTVDAYAQAADPAPLGKMVNLGGYRLHLYCTGKGRQTVVLSPGGGDFSIAWYLVQQRLESSARICSYDRAGSAWSDAGPQPMTMRQEANEVERALRISGEKGPYILVGHSIGGLVMMTFAEGYPDETAGIVLVDTPSPDSTLGYWGKLVRVRDLAKRTIPPVHTMETGSPIPIADAEREQAMKFKSRKIGAPFDRLPPEIQKLQLWAQTLPPKVGLTEETDYTPEEFEFLYELEDFGHPFGNKPLVVMIGMVDHASHEEKITAKRAERTLSTNSKVIEVEDSGHAIPLEDPSAVVGAIRETMEAVLHHAPLKQ